LAGDEGLTEAAKDLNQDDSWTVAGRTFKSRLIIGTGK